MKLTLKKETAGVYRGGPRLRFTAKRDGKKAWLALDALTGRRETVKRLKDARLVFAFVLAIEPKPTKAKEKK